MHVTVNNKTFATQAVPRYPEQWVRQDYRDLGVKVTELPTQTLDRHEGHNGS